MTKYVEIPKTGTYTINGGDGVKLPNRKDGEVRLRVDKICTTPEELDERRKVRREYREFSDGVFNDEVLCDLCMQWFGMIPHSMRREHNMDAQERREFIESIRNTGAYQFATTGKIRNQLLQPLKDLFTNLIGGSKN